MSHYSPQFGDRVHELSYRPAEDYPRDPGTIVQPTESELVAARKSYDAGHPRRGLVLVSWPGDIRQWEHPADLRLAGLPAPTVSEQRIDLDVFVKAALDARVGYVPRANVIRHAYTMACYLQTAGVQLVRDGAPWSLEGMSMNGWCSMLERRGLLAEEV